MNARNEINTGGPAFPQNDLSGYGMGPAERNNGGMTLRDWFAGQALANPAICTGEVANRTLDEWFGRYRANISRAEIVVRQALEYADAMLAASEAKP